jgi:hypothetical protein
MSQAPASSPLIMERKNKKVKRWPWRHALTPFGAMWLNLIMGMGGKIIFAADERRLTQIRSIFCFIRVHLRASAAINKKSSTTEQGAFA